MPGRPILCKVIDKTWLTPTVLQLRFDVLRRFKFIPGQFLSLVIPNPAGPRPIRRIYSLSSAPHEQFYELCVKYMNGPGTNYLKSLEVGDKFEAAAPYGDFFYRTQPGRNACFISTGTGIAPFKSIVLSKEYERNPPDHSLMLFGARTADEIIYPGRWKSMGMTEINAISGDPSYLGFKGRVTDYLRSLPMDWPWQETDFYLCGSGAMVAEVVGFLMNQRNVASQAIHKEVYFITSAAPAEGQERPPALAENLRKAG